jgi:hypothetical protein
MTYDEYIAKVKKATGRDPLQDTDYDWKAAYEDNYIPDGEHGTDKYKKPNHPTFSDESIHHGQNGNEGGKWEDLGNGMYNFIAGKTNRQWHTKTGLQDYFDNAEPDATLIYGGD